MAILSLCLMTSAASLPGAESTSLVQRLDQLARDSHMTRSTASAEGAESEAGLGASARESASADELNRMMTSVDTLDEAKKTIDQFREYGYHAGNASELKAYRQGLELLAQRLEFLARSESPAYRVCFDEVKGLIADSTSRSAAAELSPAERVRNAARTAAKPVNSRSRLSGDLLGSEVVNGNTSFEVYSPAATEVNLIVFKKPEDKTGTSFPMKKANDGIWRFTINKDLSGSFYAYSVNGPSTDGNLFDPKKLVSDPYAFANHDHDGKSIVISPELLKFKWSDTGFKTPEAKDLVIYEMHVKDLTADSSSGVAAAKRGTYLGLLEGRGTDRVLGHLQDLGVNAVELLPCQEFDNNFAGHPNHWGYMTSHFFAPECSYASGKDGEGIREFKQMVSAFH
ncbi:MAG TPA: hypothetical protein PKM25_09600, partial [Candidatus Ozemobacteraceae bacterium]|nr:hypothetical protein [Candidatus Ozemobacteraceae bacterium]